MFGFSLCLYSLSCCRFLFRLILNRKLFGNFEFFRTFAQTFYLFTFYFLAFSSVWIVQKKTETETKKPHFCRFCRKMSVFDANNILIFSVLYLYRANHTPTPPVFGTRRVGQLSSEIFLFFYFLFFVKYSDFSNSAFLPNFEHFPKHHIYF